MIVYHDWRGGGGGSGEICESLCAVAVYVLQGSSVNILTLCGYHNIVSKHPR